MLFVVGTLIGGLDVVDPRGNLIWFVPQAGVGPIAIGSGVLRGALDSPQSASSDDDGSTVTSAITPSIGRVNEMGTLYCAVAGVLNLLAILDAVHRQIDRESAEEGVT